MPPEGVQPNVNGDVYAEPPLAPVPDKAVSLAWLAEQLKLAQQLLVERESVMAAKAMPEYAAWREMVGVVNTLTQLVALNTQTSEQE